MNSFDISVLLALVFAILALLIVVLWLRELNRSIDNIEVLITEHARIINEQTKVIDAEKKVVLAVSKMGKIMNQEIDNVHTRLVSTENTVSGLVKDLYGEDAHE